MGLPLVDALPLEGARDVLDLGCGAGSLAPHLRARADTARLIGADRSRGMLRKAREAGESSLLAMDAQELALADGVFDLAILFFILFHLPDPAAGLSEVRRVLRDGGTIGLTTWAENPPLPGTSIWLEEFERLALPGDPRDPSTCRHEMVGNEALLEEMLGDAGYVLVKQWKDAFEHRWGHEDLFTLQVACGMTGRRLGAAPPDRRSLCLERVRARLEELGREMLRWRPEVLFTVATRD